MAGFALLLKCVDGLPAKRELKRCDSIYHRMVRCNTKTNVPAREYSTLVSLKGGLLSSKSKEEVYVPFSSLLRLLDLFRFVLMCVEVCFSVSVFFPSNMRV